MGLLQWENGTPGIGRNQMYFSEPTLMHRTGPFFSTHYQNPNQLKLPLLVTPPGKERTVRRTNVISKHVTWFHKGEGGGRKEAHGALTSVESRVLTLMPLSLVSWIISSWPHVVGSKHSFLNCLFLMKDPFHQGKWHRGSAIFPENTESPGSSYPV